MGSALLVLCVCFCLLFETVGAQSCQAQLWSSLIPLGRKGCSKGCFMIVPHPGALRVCALCKCLSAHLQDHSLWATELRKLLASSSYSHMGWSQNHLFFAWRLLSSHRRPGLAFFHCETGMGPTFLFPATEVLVGRTAEELLALPAVKSSQHLI